MFVLMDIEWIENRIHYISPTQIAAMRVDEQWNSIDRFYSRIAPRDTSFHTWKHMAYTGGTPSNFLYANGLHRVLTSLQDWLQEDDVICFWYEDSKNILKSVYNLVLKVKVPQRIIVLGDYVFPFLTERNMKIGNAYRICNEYGEQAPGPKHQSENDVVAMQKALRCIQYPAALLHGEPPKPEVEKKEAAPIEIINVSNALQPYQMDLKTEIFHKAGCSAIPEDATLTGHPNLKYFFRKKLTPCPHCMKKDVRQAVRERNQDIINRTQYQFIYAVNSEVFHRRNCAAILNTTSEIKGSVYYDACASTGRRPCKLCNPSAGTWLSMKEKKRAKSIARKAAKASVASTVVPGRSMNAREQRAYLRPLGDQSNHTLLLILKWACFAISIFLTLEDSLPLAHIEDSGRNVLHGHSSFL